MMGPYGDTYHCIPALCTYTADLVEQYSISLLGRYIFILTNSGIRRLLRLTKSGSTARGCPRCYTETCDFHKFCDDCELRTAEAMSAQYNHAKALLENGQAASANELMKKYSFNAVQVSDGN